MKTQTRIHLSFAPLIFGVFLTSQATAANTDLFWDANADTTAVTGGTGNWDTGSSLWRIATNTGELQTYDNTAASTTTAQLSGTAGTLTIATGTTINVNKINVGVTGYTVAGADATSVLNLSGVSPQIAGNGLTFFTSKITGTSGFTLSGGSFNVFAGDLSGLSGTVNVTGRATLQGAAYGVGNGASVLSGSQFQEWNVSNTLTSNNHGAGAVIQLGALSGSSTGLVRSGNDGNVPAAAGDDIFQVGALNTNTTFAGSIQDQSGTNITGLIKVGTGTLTLSGAGNSFTGGTLVSAGTLNITGSLTGGSAGISTNGTGIATSSSGIVTLGSTGIISGAKTFTQGSSGTSVLAGTMTHSGATTISAGELTITGTSGASGTIGAVNLRGTSSTLNFASTGTLKVTSLSQGNAATDTGVINHTAGTLTSTGDIAIGNSGGYGVYNMSGGTLNVVGLRGGSISGGGNGSSYIHQTGGAINVSGITTLNRNGTGVSVLNIDGAGAVYNQTGGNLNPGFISGGTGVVTVGAGLLSVSNDIVLSNGASNSMVNLNGGVTRTRSIQRAADGAAGSSILNLNGGVLQANVDNAAFVTGITRANIYSGGAIIDSNGKNITIGQSLQGATGNGVSGIPLAISGGGSGYLAAPVVKITGGGGSGASAVATMEGGVITGIRITSAGTGYTSEPTVTLIGGGATTAATLGSIATTANTADGGLNKTGLGTLTLNGTNTYTGSTRIESGTLALGAAGSISDSKTIIVGANTTFNVSAVAGGYTLAATQSLTGSGTVIGAANIAGTLSPGNSPGTLTVGSQTWIDGGDYNWQMLDATGAAGTGYDTISVNGTLDLTSVTAGGFGINLWSLASIAPDVNGNAGNFDNAVNQSWNLLTASGGINGFSDTSFTINISAANGTGGFTNDLNGGEFTISQSGNNLQLNFTAVPEPSTAMLLGGLGMFTLLRRRRNA